MNEKQHIIRRRFGPAGLVLLCGGVFFYGLSLRYASTRWDVVLALCNGALTLGLYGIPAALLVRFLSSRRAATNAEKEQDQAALEGWIIAWVAVILVWITFPLFAGPNFGSP